MGDAKKIVDVLRTGCIVLDMSTTNRTEIVWTMGLPAAGKSTLIKRMLGPTHQIIDSDAILATHPDYDPKRPELHHEWAKGLANAQFAAALASGEGRFVRDSTGTNAERLVSEMNRARAAGFAVRLVYVTCTMATSLARNAARDRSVPEYVIREKAEVIATSFALVAPHADSVEVIPND